MGRYGGEVVLSSLAFALHLELLLPALAQRTCEVVLYGRVPLLLDCVAGITVLWRLVLRS